MVSEEAWIGPRTVGMVRDAVATLPGADKAVIWEPVPAQIYSWSRA